MGIMKDERTYLEQLSEKIWYTKNARFVASRRMKRCEFSSIMATAMSSTYIIVINLLCFLPHLKQDRVEEVNIFSIIFSVLALVLALAVTLLNYGSRKNNYHLCGIELDNLNQEIKLKLEQEKCENCDKSITYDEKENFLKEYENILKIHNLNHIDFDYKYAQFYRNIKSEPCKNRIKYWWRWNIFDINTIYWCIIIIPSIILLIFLIHCICNCPQ